MYLTYVVPASVGVRSCILARRLHRQDSLGEGMSSRLRRTAGLTFGQLAGRSCPLSTTGSTGATRSSCAEKISSTFRGSLKFDTNCVYELSKLLLTLGVVDNDFPFIIVSADEPVHLSIEILADS